MSRLNFVLFLLFATGCSSFQWQRPVVRTATIPYIFDTTSVVGTGLKLADRGYYPTHCLKHFETTLSGGKLDIGFHLIKGSYQGDQTPLGSFIRRNLIRARRLNLGKYPPSSFILTIRVNERVSEIKEETIEFRDDVLQIIKSGDKELFFRTCGTEFIHSITFESDIFFFLSYYPQKASDAEELEREINKRITHRENDLFQLKLFKGLTFEPNSFYSLKAWTDNLFEPVEFPFAYFHGKEIDTFLNQLVHSALNSDSGKINHYALSRWTTLNRTRAVASLRGDASPSGYSDESIFNSLLSLENLVRRFRLRSRQIRSLLNGGSIPLSRERLSTCLSGLEDAKLFINWNSFYKCHDRAIANRSIDFRSLLECEPIMDAIAELNALSGACSFQDSGVLFTPPSLSDKTFLPVELVDRNVTASDPIGNRTDDYLFNDEKQIDHLPPQIQPGQGMDSYGKRYPTSCILPKSVHFSKGEGKRGRLITSNYYPFSYEEWPVVKKVLLFWKNSPRWLRYRGSFQVEGYSKRLLPDFKISEEAKKLASENLAAFYDTYGTHYVDQVRHRRGFVYYFSIDASSDRDIEITPYGLYRPSYKDSLPTAVISKIPGLGAGDSCLWSMEVGAIFSLPLQSGLSGGLLLLGHLALGCQKETDPLLKPRTLKEFFKNKKRSVMLFKEDREAIPERVSLKPWSDYLVNAGILKPHQLDLMRTGR